MRRRSIHSKYIKKLNHFDNYFWPKDPRSAIPHAPTCTNKKRDRLQGEQNFCQTPAVADLKKAYKKETDPRRRDRLLAYMQRKDGVPLDKIGGMLGRPRSTISAWLNRAQDEGMRARFERSGRGRKHLLDGPQAKQLAADLDAGPESCGFESSLWDSNLVRLHIKRKFGVQYSKTGVLQLIRETGFSWSKARPKNPRSASKKRAKKVSGAGKKTRCRKVGAGIRRTGRRCILDSKGIKQARLRMEKARQARHIHPPTLFCHAREDTSLESCQQAHFTLCLMKSQTATAFAAFWNGFTKDLAGWWWCCL